MPLPKRLQEALEASKDLPEDVREAIKAGTFFENEGEFLTTAEKKIKAKMGDQSQKAADAAAKAAREKAVQEVCDELGVTDAEQIGGIKAKLAEAAGQLNEVEKLRSELTKATKSLTKMTEDNAVLSTFRVAVVKDRAITPHIDKVHPDAREMVRENLIPRLAVDDKSDKVTAPEGKDVASYLDEMLKAKPYLKAPDYRAGAGTGPSGGKPEIAKPKEEPQGGSQGAGAGAGNGGSQNGNSSGNGAFTGSLQDAARLIAQIAREKAEPPASGAGP